jgi:hypothetical protein
VSRSLYDAWLILGGGVALYHGAAGGVMLPPGVVWQQKLTVNLKASVSTIALLGQSFEHGDPIGGYSSQTFNLHHYVPSL